MKKVIPALIFILAFFILLSNVVPVSALSSPPLLPKKIAFISKYTSRSMDGVTHEYYDRLRAKYSDQNVTIIPDSSVINGDSVWTGAIDGNDLFFVMSLSDVALGTNRTDFCKNLASSEFCPFPVRRVTGIA